ncbi:hypothetical protein [Devosia submarina]|uniref:hypothetical protein n=1 Tax=Devosia submarina TaxID=1173082 RepID=UPI000D3CD786|nr:hypothetical protein [Devosia submarina]
MAAISIAKDQAHALMEGFELAIVGKIEPVMRDNQPRWLINGSLDDGARKRLSMANRFGLRALVEKFHGLMKSLQERLLKATRLVTELEQLRDEMTPTQQAKFDLAKGQVDLEEMTL